MANTSLGVTGVRIVEKNINVLVGDHEDPGLQAIDHCAEQAQRLVHCRMSQCPERNEERLAYSRTRNRHGIPKAKTASSRPGAGSDVDRGRRARSGTTSQLNDALQAREPKAAYTEEPFPTCQSVRLEVAERLDDAIECPVPYGLRLAGWPVIGTWIRMSLNRTRTRTG
jgi:hypothetical protein